MEKKHSLENLTAYEIVEKRRIEDLQSDSYLLVHKKTGARISLLSNQDENKVFYIGFRTPPKDSTGVAHILEHSVLCGSREFPIKDPFVELVKGSLNTFLNAMTYPDKTLYPVASCNDKDFQNLMHVYLDAVLYPNIYRNENIFRQEGWHYELESEEGELTINGVVYNEMKGAFSSPDDVLERELMNSLYPDTTYGYESGGDPDAIWQLSYEQFLDFHRRYYHPSNSYIYLYGNMDMAEKLTFLDEAYLSHFEALSVDSSIALQKPFSKPVRIVREYPVSEGEREEEGYLSYNLSVGDSLDKELYIAFQILDYALCSAPGAPIKQSLTDKGIGKEVYSIYENGILQPYFSIIAKSVNTGKEEAFLQTIQEVLKGIVEKGLDKKALLAGINYYEFKYREADFGSYPKGLMYGLQMLDSWLYEDTNPFLHVEALATFRKLREKVEEGYFEALIQKYMIQNTHSSTVILKPKRGMTREKEEEGKRRLAEYKASLSVEELQQIMSRYEELQAFQDGEDSKEDLEKIPLLTREDLEKEARKLINEECNIGDTKVLFHEMHTNGIGYLRLIFKADQIPGEYFPYMGILKGVLSLLDTKNYKYGDLFNEINMVTGGMSAQNNSFTSIENPDTCIVTMELKTKVLYENIGKALLLMEEILLTSQFGDTKRLYEILAEGKSRMQAQMMSAGHSMAVGRALSYGSIPLAISESLSGITFYRMIAELEENFEEKKEELSEKLSELSKMLFRKENLLVDFVGTREGYDYLTDTIPALADSLYTQEVKKGRYLPEVSRKNEGFLTAGQVQYVCRAGNFYKKGLPYRGDLRVLKVMLGYEYLWTNIRVKGGAYGCMCGFSRTGDSYFVSYRDPNLSKTIQVFEKAAQVIADYEADERTMTQYIIGAISDLDVPMNPAAKGLFSLSAYMTGVTQEMLQKERKEILETDAQKLRELAEYMKAFLSDEYLCVVGNSGRIQEEKQMFFHIEELV